MKLYPNLGEGFTKKLVEQEVLNKEQLKKVCLAKMTSYKLVELKELNGIQSKDESNTRLPIVYKR